ncbi:hypothetical protein Zmor_003863 [Zophobas morio]|uniref:Uncharacterized protein n=1 Tax=Zophobas morio TaxID=2755281 RepID=A0AA38HN48_9CUCU|nr:hypothetical protein Zmor_003863 [Zophobas morio]
MSRLELLGAGCACKKRPFRAVYEPADRDRLQKSPLCAEEDIVGVITIREDCHLQALECNRCRYMNARRRLRTQAAHSGRFVKPRWTKIKQSHFQK